MVTLQKSEKRKDHSNRVKITLKTSENHSKASENHSEESKNYSKRVTFTFWGELTEGQLETKELSLCELPQKVKFTLLEWFSLFLEWFSLTLEWFSLVLRAIFTRLEWFLHFSLFWRVTISLFYIKRVREPPLKKSWIGFHVAPFIKPLFHRNFWIISTPYVKKTVSQRNFQWNLSQIRNLCVLNTAEIKFGWFYFCASLGANDFFPPPC